MDCLAVSKHLAYMDTLKQIGILAVDLSVN